MGEIDLFTPTEIAADGVWSVAEINRYARHLVERSFEGPVWVKAEISGFKSYRSGHWYFGIRDKSAQARCVMWRTDNQRVTVPPEDGVEVFLEVRPTVWEERGEFRLTVKQLLATAEGGLWQVRLEKARKVLEQEGLLDPLRKKPLPGHPARIGVVTSTDGAAIRDVISVAAKRWPGASIVVFPTLVQGEASERSLCRSLKLASLETSIDVLLLTRGGGSREDLWVFNLESVCRALATVPYPTVAAVGHETDTTLVELVADRRAATPSAAMEVILPDRLAEAKRLGDVGSRLAAGLARLSELESKRLERTGDRLQAVGEAIVARAQARLDKLGASLQALSPLAVLGRGYAVVRDGTGKVIRRVRDVAPGQHIAVQLSDGTFSATSAGTKHG